ncbi:MAG: HDIG domain-containing protein [Anaerolineales bacterium]|nr:MAG: HDIG domain-containing protein [Anaerolineales bacterium]
MEDLERSTPTTMERIRRAFRAARLWIIFLFGLIGVIAILSIPVDSAEQTFGLEANDVAPQDIRAPYPLSYQSPVLTAAARETAANNIATVFDPPDTSITRRQLEHLGYALKFIDAVRMDSFATREQQMADLASMADIRLDVESAVNILDLTEVRWGTVKAETLSVLEQVMRSEIRQGRSEEARRTIPALINYSLPEAQAELVGKLVPAFVAPNAIPNEEATEALELAARDQIVVIERAYAQGETIVRRGEIVTNLELEALDAFGLLKTPNPWTTIAINTGLILLLGGTFSLYAVRTHPKLTRNPNLAFVLSLLFVVNTLVLQLMIPGRTILPYLFPTATLPILLSVLFSPSMGVTSALVIGALGGFISPRGLEMSLYLTMSGALAALMIGKAERLGSFLWAGMAAAVGAAMVILVFRVPDPAMDLIGKAQLLGSSIVSGVLSTSLGFGLLLGIGNVLGITTNLQLLELSRPDHPLLQQLLRNSPGTYQHSLQVANLAEQAARAIGANALLTRVGALYHDVGKSLRAQFFIENQVSGQNIHEQLDPKTSADLILGHVRDGMELARKYRLPANIRAFINEHHGTMETSYQFRAAVDAAGGDELLIDRKHFTYTGPRPRSRETALLMLADGVEAAARAETPQTDEEIEKLVRWVFDDRLAKGQLNRTDLTLRDIDTIRVSFSLTLKNIYHPRIRYPQPAAEEDPPDLAPVAETIPPPAS